MPTVVLKDEASSDIGFLLVADDEPLNEGSDARDVILMKLPRPSHSPLAAFLDAHRHVEFSARVHAEGGARELSFPIRPDQSFQAHVPASGLGSWAVSSVGDGTCQLLSK